MLMFNLTYNVFLHETDDFIHHERLGNGLIVESKDGYYYINFARKNGTLTEIQWEKENLTASNKNEYRKEAIKYNDPVNKVITSAKEFFEK